MRSIRPLLLGLALLPAPLLAQAPAPSRDVDKPFFEWSDLGWLAVTAGGSYAISRADPHIAREFLSPRFQDNSSYRSIEKKAVLFNEKSEFIGAIAFYGIGKLAHSEGLARTSAHVGEAVFGVSAATTVIRGALGRSRPFASSDSNQYDFKFGKGFSSLTYRAFPSIHAAASFATATVITEEVGRSHPGMKWPVGIVLYSAASLPGLGRMYIGKHWASDVFAGAASGLWTGIKVERYTHSHPNNWVDRHLLGTTALAPTPDGGLAIVRSVAF